MPARPFVWKRAHSVAAAVTAVALVGGGVGVATALRPGPAPQLAPPVGTPTPTVSPSAVATPTAAPTSKPAPSDPLTGRRPSDHEVLAVKIENIQAARPQAGVGEADIVFVEEVEARLTRMIAVFHTNFPQRVGPVRSARNTDVQLLPMFGKPGLVYSGANRKVQANIDKSSIKPLQRSTRDTSRVAPHNVFVDLAQIARSAKVGTPQSIGWTFATRDPRWTAAPKADRPSGKVGADTMSFDWSKGRYGVRWNGQGYSGGARTDNVVVLEVQTRPDGNADVNGSRSVKSSTVGSGRVTVYRDGKVLKGTWRRTSAGKPMHLEDRRGQDLPLKPGQTWVLLAG